MLVGFATQVFELEDSVLAPFNEALNDSFFDEVVINCEDATIKQNRINLLENIASMCNKAICVANL